MTKSKIIRQKKLNPIIMELVFSFLSVEKIRKYFGESGVTDATENIRQRFFRKKAKVDQGLVGTVDEALDLIKS